MTTETRVDADLELAHELLTRWVPDDGPDDFAAKVAAQSLDPEEDVSVVPVVRTHSRAAWRRWASLSVAAAAAVVLVFALGRWWMADPVAQTVVHPRPPTMVDPEPVVTAIEPPPRYDGPVTWCGLVRRVEAANARYPFDESAPDLPLQEFEDLYGPRGLAWTFYEQRLEALIPYRDGGFVLPADSSIDPKVIDFYRAVRDGIDTYFRGKDGRLGVDMEVRLSGAQGISELILTSGDESVSYRNGPRRWQRLSWGVGKGARLLARGFGLEGSIVKQGPWGLIRLLNAGSAKPQQGFVEYRFDLTDQGAGVVGFDMRSVNPAPAIAPVFSRYRLPPALTVGGETCDP